MTIHSRKIKLIEFSLGTDPTDIAFECQVQSWNINNNTEDGEKIYSLCPTGEDEEETDPDYTLSITAYADWRSDGLSDFMWKHDGETMAVALHHHPDIPAEHVSWTGQVKIKAPSVGGEARTTEMTEFEIPFIGKPVYARADESA